MWSAAWSPDGSTVALATAMHDGRDLDLRTHVALLPAAGGKPEIITTEWDGIVGPIVWTPDGAGFYLVTNQDREFAFQIFEGEHIQATGEQYVKNGEVSVLVGPAQRPRAFIRSGSPHERRSI